MSLNDKYIINGSTLSAIGDALREKNIPPKEIQAETNVYYKNYTSPWINARGSATIDAAYFGLTSQTPVRIKMEIIAKNGSYGMYAKGADESGYSSVSVGKTYQKTLPVQLMGEMTSYNSQIVAKLYPLDQNSNYIIPTSEDDTSGYSTEVATIIMPNPNRQILVQDIASLISNNFGGVSIDYEGWSYGYLSVGNASEFYTYSKKDSWMTFIPLTSGQKIGFCIGETVSNRLRAGFFQGKTYSNFQQYVNQSGSNTKVIGNGVLVTGSSDLSGDGLLKRFYYTAPSDGELIVMTSSDDTTPAPLHIWRA